MFLSALSIFSAAALATTPPAPAVALGPGGARSAVECPLEITSNKPYLRVTVNGSPPQWFILDTGCAGGSVIARECADRLQLPSSGETRRHLGAGAGVSVGIASTPDVTLGVAGDTMGAPALRVFSLAHVSPFEGRRVDGLLGEDFLRRHVVQIDYAGRTLRVLEPGTFAPPAGATVVPIELESGLAVARGTLAPAGRGPIDCHFVIDTGVRTTLVVYHPFAVAHGLLDAPGNLIAATIGGGAGGETRGDIGRLDSLSIGSMSFPRPTVIFSRDTVGVFADREPDGIVGGELLRRCRVTFDYPHARLILEPYPGPPAAFDYDMSGLFLVGDGPEFRRIVVQSVTDRTPAAEAGLLKGDEILAIDGRRAPDLTLEEARELFRTPARRRLEVMRAGQRLQVRLTTRRLV